jgi:hypothetical protein
VSVLVARYATGRGSSVYKVDVSDQVSPAHQISWMTTASSPFD